MTFPHTFSLIQAIVTSELSEITLFTRGYQRVKQSFSRGAKSSHRYLILPSLALRSLHYLLKSASMNTEQSKKVE